MNIIKGIFFSTALAFISLWGTNPLNGLAFDDYSLGGFFSDPRRVNQPNFDPPVNINHFIPHEVVTSDNPVDQPSPISPSLVSRFTGTLLNYPNPFSMRSGTTIGYQLTGPMAIELRIYSQTGYLVFQTSFLSTQEGGLGKYNHVPINNLTLNGTWLSPGIYIYALFSDGRLVAKNRMVVTP